MVRAVGGKGVVVFGTMENAGSMTGGDESEECPAMFRPFTGKSSVETRKQMMQYSMMKMKLGAQVYEDAEEEEDYDDGDNAEEERKRTQEENVKRGNEGTKSEATKPSIFKPLASRDAAQTRERMQYSMMKVQLGTQVYDDVDDDDEEEEVGVVAVGDDVDTRVEERRDSIEKEERLPDVYVPATAFARKNVSHADTVANLGNGDEQQQQHPVRKSGAVYVRRSQVLSAHSTLGYSCSAVPTSTSSSLVDTQSRHRRVFSSPPEDVAAESTRAVTPSEKADMRTSRLRTSLSDKVMGGFSRVKSSRRKTAGGERFY